MKFADIIKDGKYCADKESDDAIDYILKSGHGTLDKRLFIFNSSIDHDISRLIESKVFRPQRYIEVWKIWLN